MCLLYLSLIDRPQSLVFFFFNDTATTEIYTLSLHDALPICARRFRARLRPQSPRPGCGTSDGRSFPSRPGCSNRGGRSRQDRKSTRLNSSHSQISYAVFCLKKKKQNKTTHRT